MSDEAIELSRVFPDRGRLDNKGRSKDGLESEQDLVFGDTRIALDGNARGTA